MGVGTPAGAVLTGGASSRMGTDKAVLVVGGRPMAVRVADALWEAGCSPVWCQGGDAAAIREIGLDSVPDALPGEGPLAAIVAALAHADGADVAVAACDLVDLDAATVQTLLAARSRDIDVVVASAGGRDHLLGVWSATSADRVVELVDDGVRSLHEALAALRVVRVDVEPTAVRNVNRVDDLG